MTHVDHDVSSDYLLAFTYQLPLVQTCKCLCSSDGVAMITFRMKWTITLNKPAPTTAMALTMDRYAYRRAIPRRRYKFTSMLVGQDVCIV